MKKHGEGLIYSGAWVILIGTIVSVIGLTNEVMNENSNGAQLVAGGNAIEAIGNSLQAIGNTELFLKEKEQFRLEGIIGGWLQAGGNITNTIATEIEIHTSEEEGQRLNAIGSGVQGLGAAYEAIGAAKGNSPTKSLEVIGNSLFSIGTFLDATGELYLLKKLEFSGDKLSLIGVWLQIIGACTEIIALTIASKMEEAEQTVNVYPYFNLEYDLRNYTTSNFGYIVPFHF